MQETNETIKVIQNHKSIRQYLDKDITDETLNTILKSVQQMPNSINGQQTSILIIRDEEKKKAIAKLSRDQQWIIDAPVFLVVVMDFYKTHIACQKNGKEMGVVKNINGVMVGSVDAGIMIGGIVIASESMGLGSVVIGGIRENITKLPQILDLPNYTLPIAGICLGYPNPEFIPKSKPRLPYATFVHKENYETQDIKELIDDYDKETASYLKSIGREQEGNWSKLVASYYAHPHYHSLRQALIEQGFELDS